ncbi:MAG: SirB1 family protein [Alphaproteobacteria bacterium]|jgi:regulator of sirC expression with transglutaminase-like and TPR domain
MILGPAQLIERLREIGQASDASIPVGHAALYLSALDHPGIDLAPYIQHLDQMEADARERIPALRRGMSETEAIARILSDTIANRHGYAGDHDTFDDPQNADLIRVIDRRRGLPVSLGILYLEIARRLGVRAQGMNTPGHFLMRVGEGEQARILDPFNGGLVLAADDLRPLGPAQGVAAPEYGPAENREVLLRLLNNIRSRALASKDMRRVLEIAERMVLVSPRQPDLWLDLSRANEATGKLKGAIQAAQKCMALADRESVEGREAAFSLASLRRRLN